MQYRRLGNTNIEVSVICRGTMTWGEQNTRSHAFDQMVLAFANSRPFLTSSIIGATTMEQLHNNIVSIYIEMTAEVLEGMQAIHEAHPCPDG